MTSRIVVNNIEPDTGISSVTVNGGLTVTGLLKYEDVKNIDSIGIITARDGLRVTGIATISGDVLIGTTNTTTIGTVNKNLVVGSTTNNDEVGLTLNVMEGVHNRRAKFFLDDDDGVFGVDSTASTGVPTFVVRSATTERLSIASDGATKVCHNGGAFGVGGDPINKFGITASDNNFFGLHRSNASTGTGEFNINVEVNSQVTFSMDDEGAFSFGTTTDPSAQSGYSEKLRISKEGYVTKPTNPIFNAFGGPSNVATNTDIVFGQERFDIGSGYNTSDGVYTAPVTGYYHFYAQVYRVDTSSDSWWGYYLDTGSGYSQISESRIENDANGHSGSGYSTLQCSIYWYMTAGHKIKCRVGTAGNIHCNTTLSYFCGNLVG